MIGRPTERASGQIVVIFAVALVAIALIVGLVVDGGMAFLQRRDAQNDADLAALAGTKLIADAWIDPGETAVSLGAVYDALDGRLTSSGCAAGGSEPCSWTARLLGPAGSDLGALRRGSSGFIRGSNPPILGVRIDVTRRPRTFFLGLVGQAGWQISASATALTAEPTTAPDGQLLPIALYARPKDAPFTKGQVYDLTPDRIAPGGFAWVDWAQGGSTVADSTCVPDNPRLDLGSSGTLVPRAPWTTPWDRVRDCLEHWRISGATVLIPTYDGDRRPPGYRLTGVDAFVVRGVGDQDPADPARFDIQAAFVGTFAFAAGPAEANRPPQPTDSMYYLGLVK